MFEQKASPDTTAPVIDVTLQNFMQEVIHASLKVPVAVYFWSPRSPACEQFGALLQKETSSYSGKLKLARVNVDEHPQIAQQFRIQGVPALYLFAQGQPVDGFMGILPEAQVKQFFSRLLGPADQETLIKEQIERAQQFNYCKKEKPKKRRKYFLPFTKHCRRTSPRLPDSLVAILFNLRPPKPKHSSKIFPWKQRKIQRLPVLKQCWVWLKMPEKPEMFLHCARRWRKIPAITKRVMIWQMHYSLPDSKKRRSKNY